MNRSINLVSHAKINLFLKIFHKDIDSFHKIFTLFYKIPFYDDINISLSYGKKIININYIGDFAYSIKNSFFDFKTQSNQDTSHDFILSCLVDFYKKWLINLNIGINIVIKKNIPIGAGLGGASGNLASIMNFLFDEFLIDSNRSDCVKKYTSDGEFFIQNKNTSFCSDRGNQIIDSSFLEKYLEKFSIMVIFPYIISQTKDMYEKYYQINKNNQKNLRYDYNLFFNKINNIRSIEDLFKIGNDFELVVDDKIKFILNRIKKYTNLCSLNGSGSSCFVFLKNKKIESFLFQEFQNDNFFIKVIKLN